MESNINLRSLVISNISTYRNLIIIFSIIFVVIILSYYVSDKYRISKTLERLDIFENYMSINSIYDFKTLDEPLSNFYIASAFRPYTCKNQMGEYISPLILTKILRYGARCLYIDVYTNYKDPVVSVGLKKGNWKLSLNPLTFDSIMETIGTTAFTSGAVNNFDDPLFIALNLNVQGDFKILKKIKESIIKHCGTKLLDISYGYNQKNIANEPLKNFKNKAVIICSEGFENSSLEEVVNASWDSNVVRKINNVSIDSNVKISTYVKEDTDTLMNYNKSALSLIVPEESSFFTRQYNSNQGFEFGCQFICMHYQKVDGSMDFYATKFRNASFVLKPKELRGESRQPPVYETLNTTLTKEDMKDPIKANCNTQPLPYVPKRDFTSMPTFKKTGEENGMCFISKRPCASPFTKLTTPLTLIGNEKNKDLEILKKGNVNVNAGIDTDGFKFYNIEPNICCANEENVPINKKYVLSNICENPARNKGTIGIKVKNEDVNKTGFIRGKESDKGYLWTHPKICEVEDVKELKSQKFCVVSQSRCPLDYSQTKINLENGLRLCCREENMN